MKTEAMDSDRRSALLARLYEWLEPSEEGCWNWRGATNHGGYGVFSVTVAFKRRRQYRVHRLAYELIVGPIPEGLTIDHLCRNRLCANPVHLEPVTAPENSRRGHQAKTHCKAGHPFDEANTSYRPIAGGYTRRVCKKCAREKALASYHAKKVFRYPDGRSGPPTKTHCLRGHELSDENVYTGSRTRQCRPCARARYAEKKANQ